MLPQSQCGLFKFTTKFNLSNANDHDHNLKNNMIGPINRKIPIQTVS